ncbi:hypothetical protein GCK32_019089, partial [Trichostrongylus colubriformis]
REPVGIVKAGSKNIEDGWSAKFSEFSFLSSAAPGDPQLTCSREGPQKHLLRDLTSHSPDGAVSTTSEQHSSTALSKVKNPRTTPVATGLNRRVDRSALATPQKKSFAVSVPSSTPSNHESCAQRNKQLHSTSTRSMDSDDDFFDL